MPARKLFTPPYEEVIMSALRKVLVVDDDPVIGSSFKRVLSGKGYAVITADDGYDALIKLQEERYDLVFTDIKMPGIDGLQVAEHVRAQQPWLPVVIVTGYGSGASEERAKKAGVSDFLRKPLSPEMIEASASKALHQPAPAAEVARPEAPAVVAPEPPAAAKKASLLKNMALFLSAPFIGLLYAVLLPFVGIGMLAWVVAEPLLKHERTKDALRFVGFIGQLAAAPFIGLAFVVLFPIVGLAMLAWTEGRALVARPRAE